VADHLAASFAGGGGRSAAASREATKDSIGIRRSYQGQMLLPEQFATAVRFVVFVPSLSGQVFPAVVLVKHNNVIKPKACSLT
jgi:hypothetical protein